MARINNKNRYPIKPNPTGQDTIILNDSENNEETVTATLESVVALALAGGTDTFATLNGNIITFPDGQTADITPVVDTDTDTFATLAGTVITFADGSVIDATIENATLNGNIITFGDGQTADITPVVDTDTDTFATLSGGTITFPDGQTITVPSGSTDDQIASEVPVSPITGLVATQVQEALVALLAQIPNQTSDLTNDGSDGSSPFITSSTLPSYTIDINANNLRLLSDTVVVSTVDLSLYLDDTNLARLVSGTLDANSGIATFTRDDNTTFTVDMSSLVIGAGVGLTLNGMNLDLGGTLPDDEQVTITLGQDVGGQSTFIIEGDQTTIEIDNNELQISGDNIDISASTGLSINSDSDGITMQTSNGGNFILDNGSGASIGDVWTATGMNGEGYWATSTGGGAFESIDEGNGLGIVVSGRNAANYGNVGSNAFDASFSNSPFGAFGATGLRSFAANLRTTASGESSVALGSSTIASGNNSFAMGNSVRAIGLNSVALGIENRANSFGEIHLGIYGTNPTANNSNAYNSLDRLFNVGNGNNGSSLSDAFTIRKDGLITAPSLTDALITAAGNDVLINKGWAQANLSGGVVETSGTVTLANTTLQDSSGGATYSVSSVSGNWYRNGRICHFNILLEGIVMTGTPTGRFRILNTEIPQRESGGTSGFLGGSSIDHMIGSDATVANLSPTMFFASPNFNIISFRLKDQGNVNPNSTVNPISFPTSGAGGSLEVSGTYIIDNSI